MTIRRHLQISLLLICLIASCATPLPTTPVAPSILPNELVMAEGQVTIKRREATDFVPTGVGAQVEPGDLLRVEGGEAAIFCGNATQWDTSPRLLTGGESHGVPCLAGRSPRSAPDLTRLRGETGSRVDNIPYVLSPRSGFVRSDRPTLRWHTLANTGAYTVTLTGDDELERPPVQASGGELPYPDGWPSLAGGGASYSLVVQAGERSSEEEGSGAKSWGFSLLDPAQAAQLQSQEAKLRSRPLGEDALTLLLAELYLSDAYRLRSEAAELLSGAAVENLASAQVLLGEVYLEMGLVDEAQPAFDRARILAEQAGLPESEAGAAFGLGTVACLRREQAQAEGYWQAAQTQYEALGMGAQAQAAADRLRAAQTECTR
jgi:hypothetical protein